MHRAPPPVTGASNPSRTSPGPIEHKNRRQPPVQQTPNHNNDGELRALREEVCDSLGQDMFAEMTLEVFDSLQIQTL
ncbi:hypothetical protein MRX96_007682 [Rhipicephalus microplus]